MNDIELARLLANSMSGNVSDWPQLKPLLRRMALLLELYGKVRKPPTPPRYDDVFFDGVERLDAVARGEIEG